MKLNKSRFFLIIESFLVGKATRKEAQFLGRMQDHYEENSGAFDEEDVQKGLPALEKEIYENVSAAIFSGVRSPNHTHSTMQWKAWLVRAAALFVLVLGSWSVFNYRMEFLNLLDPVHLISKHVTDGSISSIKFTDGTQVWLNAGSTIRYPDKFRGRTREVTVSGQAFFRVAHSDLHPFIVHTRDFITQVLGTSFTIRSFPEESVSQVVLVSGKISVKMNGINKKAVVLLPGQRAQHFQTQKDGELAITNGNNLEEASAWISGRLVFSQAPMDRVVRDLERKYAIHITLTGELAMAKISGAFDQRYASDAIRLLAASVSAQCIQKGSEFQLRPSKKYLGKRSTY